MNISLSLDLLLYGVMLIGFSVFAHCQVPDPGGATPLTGLVVGVLSAFWGVRGLLGFYGRAGAVVTIGVLTVVLLALVVNAWLAVGAGVQSVKPIATMLAVLLVFAIGQLANFAQAGRRSPANLDANARGIATERDSHPSRVFDK